MASDLSMYVPIKADPSGAAMSGCFNAKLNKPIEIVKRFSGVNSNMKGSELDFYQLVSVIKQLKTWETSQCDEFIVQFFDDPGFFNSKCSDMVYSFCQLRWRVFSPEVRVKFVEFLVNIASYNPVHVNLVLRCIVINCFHAFPDNVETPDEAQFEECETIFQLGLQALYKLFPVNSVRVPLIPPMMWKLKPFKNAPIHEFYLFVRLLITFADRYVSIAKELWFCLIDMLLKFDGEVSHDIMSQQLKDVRQIFPKHDENVIDESDLTVNKTREKLDLCMTIVFCYISLGAADPKICPTDYPYTKWMKGFKPSKELFSYLVTSLEAQVLTVHELENVQFIWFYMCLEDKSKVDRLLQHLWTLIITPLKTPNDWKKTHNAVTFMAGLLARADYVEIEVAHFWLKQMIEWCVTYVNNARQVKFGGGIQHSTFYATVQAAFFLLCFRYKEFNNDEMAENIRSLGIARIVHSRLEPLNFIPRSLALFFASISRYMQIVYCNHIVNMNDDQIGVETCFPFLRHGLIEASKYFQRHLRVFVPAENDLATINTVRSRRTTEVVSEEGDYDFLMEVDYADDGIEAG